MRGLYEEALGGVGSMSGEFQADLPPGGSRRWRHAPRGGGGCRKRILQEEEETFGQLCSRSRFHEKEAPIEGGWGWGSIRMRGSIRRLQEEKAPCREKRVQENESS